jgi:diaminopimelate decarboxylase
VVDVKTSHGKIFAVTDGGMNQNAAGAGIGRVMREDVPVLVLRQEEAGADCQPVTIVGPSCTPVDILHSGLPVAAIETGDIVAVPQAGAYGLALSPIYFCGHPTPAEVLVSEDEIRLIRRRGTLEELLWNTDV